MRTLNIAISDSQYKKFGIQSDKLKFTELVTIINRELIRSNLDKCVEFAHKNGLSDMSLAEISEEVKAVRRNAKGNN